MQSASPRGSTPDRAGRAKAPAGPLDPAAVAGLYATGAGQVKTQTRAPEVVGTREAGRSGPRLMLARAGSWVPIRRGSRGSKSPRPAAARLAPGSPPRSCRFGDQQREERRGTRRRGGVRPPPPARRGGGGAGRARGNPAPAGPPPPPPPRCFLWAPPVPPPLRL